MFAQVLGELEEISRRLVPAALDGGGAAAFFNDAARAERLCTAIKSRLARRVDETRVWRESGHRSAAHWVAEATGETVGAASRTLETARALDALPETEAAFRSGQLSEVQAAEVAGAAAAEPHAEAELLEACAVSTCANDQFLEIDHIVPLEHHGRTELDNLWRLCSHHHRLKTYGGWKVVGRNGTRDLVPPDDPDPPVPPSLLVGVDDASAFGEPHGRSDAVGCIAVQ